ncbi:MAG: beta strand repeat-containing protein, partial [Janthinobacterium lividum]
MTLSYSSRPTCARLVRHLASRLPGWLLLALLPLLAHAGNPVLTLQATVPAGATDVTAFVDQVEVINPATGAVVASAVPNAGFETFTSLGNTTYGYTPAGATWAFASNSGIATNGSAFGNPAAPEGTHVAFLQTTSSGAGSFSQLLPTLAAGYYQLRVRVAQRNLGPANQGVALLLDGREVGRVVPANDGVFHTYTTAVLPFDQLVLRFEAAGSGTTADVTAFVDQVELLLGGTAVSPGIPNAGFENTGSLGTGQQAYVPTGTGWTYSGNAGIMANGYGFGAYTNIEGTHAGFLQSNGTQGTGSANYGKLARGLPLLATGTYTLRLLAAQRNSATADQKIYVYVGSTALSSIVPPNDGSFHSYTPGTFTVAVPTITGFSPGSGAAGTLVTLSGSNLNGATYVSVDGVAVVPTNVSGSSLKFVLPAGLNSPTPSIVVTTPQGLSVPSTAFTVQFNPAISSFSPPSGPLGTVVALTGTDFTGLSSVLVGESPALFTVVSNTSATFTVPRGATSQKVRVSNASSTGLSATAFTVTRPSASTIFPGGANLTTNSTANLNVGTNAAPAVMDVDGDGLLDLLVGNSDGIVARFEQTTANGSVFALVGNLTTNGTTDLSVGTYAAPTVSDVDGDGLLDLLVGNYDGIVARFEQTTANGSVFALVGNLTTDGTTDLNVGTRAAPTVSDVDGDGLLDLLVGNDSGTVQRFEQTTANGSVFALVGNLTTNGTTNLNVGAFAAPAVSDVDGDGLLDLLVGNNSGIVARFEQTTANGGAFAFIGNLTTDGTTALDVGTYAAPTVSDVDGDGLLDLLVGNGSGTVQRYEQADPPTALALAPQAVAENEASGTLVGTFATTDATTGDTFTYTLVAGPGGTDNASFAIGTGPNAGKLVTAAVFDFETKASYTVRVRTTDATGIYYEQAFTISITDVVVDAPTLTSFTPASGPLGTVLTLTGTDFTGLSSVLVGESPALFTVVSNTSATAMVPRGATSQRVRVSNAVGTGLSATAFTVTRPSASAVFPGGANLTTNGTANLNVGNRAA